MLVKEREAYKFICQEMTKSSSNEDIVWCEGQKCMGWRWLDPKTKKERRGYCGKVGRPLPELYED